jgi:hypothetical protein
MLAIVSASPGAASALSARFFRAPDNNIGCVMVKGPQGQARCDILHHRWKPPPKPRSCPVDWGYGLAVGVHGRGNFFCAGDSAINPNSQHLRYGHSIVYGRFRCESARSGIRCSNKRTHHGFKLSRTLTRRF